MKTQETAASLLLTIALAAPVKLLRHANKIPSALGYKTEIASKDKYNNLLVNFVDKAVNTPPPAQVNTSADIMKTCIYINNTILPLPNACVPLLRELSQCSNLESPTKRCYKMIGAEHE
jgi:hypothetical protein